MFLMRLQERSKMMNGEDRLIQKDPKDVKSFLFLFGT